MKEKIQAFFQRKRKEAEPPKTQNAYYENVSAGLGIFQVILYLSLFAFVVLSFFRNTNLITYQNFYYFFKDLNASAETVDVIKNDFVTYPTSDSQSFTLYRKGLAVAGKNGVTVFTASGRQTVSKILNYQNPIAVGSGKYLLVYEMGGTRYSLYNSYTQVHSGESEFPILGGSVSDSGSYALISSTETASSVVFFYNDQFALLGRYSKQDAFVMDVAIHEKGNSLAILYSVPRDGTWQSILSLYKKGKSQSEFQVDLSDSLGFDCSFTDSGMIGAICGNGVYYVSDRGVIKTEYVFQGKEIADAVLGKDGATVCLKPRLSTDPYEIIVFDKSGKLLYNDVADSKVEQIDRYQNSVYFTTADSVCKLNLKSAKTTKIAKNTDKKVMLAVDENEILLCSPQKAEYLNLDNP